MNYRTTETVYGFFSTSVAGVPTTLAGTPALSVYKTNSTTQSTAGVTLSVDFDSVTGLHHYAVDLSADAFYAVDTDYSIIITTGTVGGTSVVGRVVGSFTTRVADVDVAKLSGDATAADNLEAACDGTTYNLGGGAVVAASVTGAVGSVTGNVGGNVAGSVASVTGAVGSVTGNVGGNVAGSVTSVTAGVTLADDAITAAKFDESTAFPLAQADTGASAVARVGADSDTLETISDQIDAISAGSSPTLMQSTTIATLASQTSFTLTAGSGDDDAYNDCLAIFTDQSTSTQKGRALINDYTGATKTVTLDAGPEFTVATGDTVAIIAVPKQLDGKISGVGGVVGSGSSTWGTAADFTLETAGGSPIEGAEVWITSDAAGATVVAGTQDTDTNGQLPALFRLDPGTYYLWVQKGGYNAIAGTAITVS